MLAHIPVQPLEPLFILYPVAARHEHDMIRLAVRLYGGHTCLEKLDAVYLSLLEPVDGTAECPLCFIEKIIVPGRIVIAVKCNPDSTELERFERMPVVEPVGIHAAEHTAGVSMSGHHRHTAIAFPFVFPACASCGCIRRFPGFPPPESDDMQQSYCKDDQ